MNGAILFSLAISLMLIALTRAQNNTHDDDLGMMQYAKIGAKVCMDDLGCFEITKDFFHLLYRPINMLPNDRATVGTEFHLYTKKHPMEFNLVKFNDKASMKELDITHRTVFIIHGFIDSKYYGKWMESLKDHILLSNDFNVIIVDWSKGNTLPYTKATANCRVVGAEIALLIENLIKYMNVDPMKVHLVGHSLGAHIAGYAGERLKKLGRITGLDPAAPYFQYMPPSVRLDPTDADFVDIIHTDSSSIMLLALGMKQEVGHVDFYPNNGMKQPGCGTAGIHSIFLEGLVDASRQFMSCNHQRATEYFIYSINHRRAQPVGFQCANWLDFLAGKCSDCSQQRCAIMGMYAEEYRRFKDNKKSKTFYVTTSTKRPYWEYVFHITIKLFKPKKGSQDKRGTINIEIQGDQRSYNAKYEATDLANGAAYSFLVRQPQHLGVIKGVTVKWTSKTFSLLSSHNLNLEHVIIKSLNAGDESSQKQQTKKFCNKGNKPIASKKSAILSACV
ncbi:pancreatic lipase-related protein 2-like [Parasteatoda tepidariorum]|uniref:pancreatic lipase-related protein 2-like n=1 Tax=Parasteatoda tepidariorum TaxID=114398 RepID=UPI00077F936B|nr:pancreatic lipase-related protein 2-like [Parasteatoda tepidariorum]